MKTEQPTLITSILAAADFSNAKNHFIGFDGNFPAYEAKALGVLTADTAEGEMAPVIVSGIALVKSGTGILFGAKIQSDVDGRAIPLDSGEPDGFALEAATGADELIRVLLI